MTLPAKIYTEKDLESARARSKIVGWVQGAGVVFAGGVVLNLLGWIPMLVVAGGVAYIGYRLLSGSSAKEKGED